MSKLAWITGATSGLGKALSFALAKEGYSLLLVSRDLEKLRDVASQLPPSTEILVADLSRLQDRQVLIPLLHEKTPDLLINNAGFGLYGPVLSHSTSLSQEMLQVNAQAVMELSIEGARALREKNKPGTILNISSAAAFFVYPTFCVYAATKAFLNTFSLGLDEEMKPYGIRILTSCPGQIDTDFRSHASGNFPQKKDKMTMPTEKATRLILKQIRTQRQLLIIDWRTQGLIWLGRLLPKRWVRRLLRDALSLRYAHTEITNGLL